MSTRKCVCVCAMVTRFHSEGVCERENEGASASDSGMLMMTLINLINSFGKCVCERVERASASDSMGVMLMTTLINPFIQNVCVCMCEEGTSASDR